MNTYWTYILSRHTCLAIQYCSSSVLNLSIFTPSHATLSSEVILSMAPSSITIHRKMTHIFVSSDKHSALKFGPMHLVASLTTAWCFPDISIKLSSKELLRLSLPSILWLSHSPASSSTSRAHIQPSPSRLMTFPSILFPGPETQQSSGISGSPNHPSVGRAQPDLHIPL